MKFFTVSASPCIILFSSLLYLSQFQTLWSQQPYVDNKQLDCYQDNNLTTTNGYTCNGPQTSCLSYITFRSQPPYYDSATTIAYLLHSNPSNIARINNITDVEKIPANTVIVVPVNCSCTWVNTTGSLFYQHNSFYTLKTEAENYFTVSNDTYEGLTTCQAMMNQNPYDSRNLSAGMELLVPLRCACPSKNQTANGVKFLLSYLVTWGNDIDQIGATFNVNEQSVLDANQLSSTDLIYPFTPILVPLKAEPTKIRPSPPPPPTPLPFQMGPPSEERGQTKKKWVFVGIGIGVAAFVLVLFVFLLWFILSRWRKNLSGSTEPTTMPKKIVRSISSKGVMGSLTVYKFEELQKATGNFAEDHKIRGSVYRGLIKGANAAIKRTAVKTESEINILQHVHHSSIIMLSGFCMNKKEGNTYLVYEFAENGSLSDWLHHDKEKKYFRNGLGWKQRVQIAYDVANGLNYLHNYANPPYIHMAMKSSNILLSGDFRAKITNFGSARTVDNDHLKSAENKAGEDGGSWLLTRHVVGTQGYMAPEYTENGFVTPKLDVFAFGVVMLELLSGKEATNTIASGEKVGRKELLCASIKQVLEGENVKENLERFMDPSLSREDYPLDLAFSMAHLAMTCVAEDLNSRPTMNHVFLSLSMILSSTLDGEPSNELGHSRSSSHANIT